MSKGKDQTTEMNKTLIGKVTDSTPESLLYGDYRGYVEIDAESGEWLRNVDGPGTGAPVYSEEYEDLREAGELP